jgi:branched-chain amino acid transport system substrate-binding protein
MGKRRAVLVETETMYGHSMGSAFSRAFLSLGGRIAERRTVREGSRDFDPVVASLRADFDLLFYGGSFEGAFILRAMRRAGLDQLFASGDGCWDAVNFLEPAGETATLGEGILVLSATPAVGRVAGSSDFAARYAALFGPIGNYAVNSYDSARVLIAAIKNAIAESKGNPSRRDVLTAMRKLRFKGIAYGDPVQWDEKGDNLPPSRRSMWRRMAGFDRLPKSRRGKGPDRRGRQSRKRLAA